MVQSGDHLQIKDVQTMTNIAGEVLNVYYFEVISITSPQPLFNIAYELRDWWFGEFLPDILLIQSNNVRHTRVIINNVENYETDFVEIVPVATVTGIEPSDFSASSTAWSFQLQRQFRTTRHGSKRIPGVPESMVSNNAASPGIITALDDVAALLGNGQIVELPGGEQMVLAPVIAKTPTPPATVPTVFNNIVAAQYRGLGTQNSRKQYLS